MRGNPIRQYQGRRCLGSIPARAGEPSAISSVSPSPTVYPRACGGTTLPYRTGLPASGLSPRVRGNHGGCCGCSGHGRSIPARAGIHPPKRQFFEHPFELPVRSRRRKPASSKSTKPKERRKSDKVTELNSASTKPGAKTHSKSSPAKQPKIQPQTVNSRTTKPAKPTTSPQHQASAAEHKNEGAISPKLTRQEYESSRNQRPERKEANRLRTNEIRQQRIALGLCVGCGKPASSGQTRCRTCAAKHQEYRKIAAKRQATAKLASPTE